MYIIDDEVAYNDYKEYLNSSPEIISVKGNIITTKDFVVEVKAEYVDILDLIKTESHKSIVENSGYKFKTY